MWYVKVGDFIEKALGNIFYCFFAPLNLLASVAERLMVLAAFIAVLAWAFGDARWYVAAPDWPNMIRTADI